MLHTVSSLFWINLFTITIWLLFILILELSMEFNVLWLLDFWEEGFSSQNVLIQQLQMNGNHFHVLAVMPRTGDVSPKSAFISQQVLLLSPRRAVIAAFLPWIALLWKGSYCSMPAGQWLCRLTLLGTRAVRFWQKMYSRFISLKTRFSISICLEWKGIHFFE